MLRRKQLFWASGLVLTCAAGRSEAQFEMPRIKGLLETYHVASGSGGDSQAEHTIRWLTVSARLSPAARLVGGFMSFRERHSLDENYLELQAGGGQQWRVGRFRTAFGHSDWSENYYAGFPRMAMLRTSPLGRRIRMNRLDTGVEWQGSSGGVQQQLAIVDTNSSITQLMADNPPSLASRTQVSHKNLMVGFNVLTDLERFEQGNMRLFDLDWRWSIPHLQLRGEMLYGKVGAQHPRGFYLDFFYHPPELTRTTFIARTEALNTGVAGTGFAHLHTVGIKQIISSGLTAELTHAWSNALDPARSRRGWALQFVTFTHF